MAPVMAPVMALELRGSSAALDDGSRLGGRVPTASPASRTAGARIAAADCVHSARSDPHSAQWPPRAAALAAQPHPRAQSLAPLTPAPPGFVPGPPSRCAGRLRAAAGAGDWRRADDAQPRPPRALPLGGRRWEKEASCEPCEPCEVDEVWLRVRTEARAGAEEEPFLASYMYSAILAHPTMESALGFHLANKLANPTLLSTQLKSLFTEVLCSDARIQEAIRADLVAVKARDPACLGYTHAMLNFKGYLACQTHRIAHRLWGTGRQGLALALANRITEVFHVEIHPAARVGKGVFLDHATGLVIGETAVVGDNVSVLHHVTLGGTGNLGRQRHPCVEEGVLIGAGAKLLGPITVGVGAKIGACSVVLESVPPGATVVGNPGRVLEQDPHSVAVGPAPSETMDHAGFADYVI